MDILNSRGLKARAKEKLSVAACDHKKLVLIHTGIIVGANILISLLQLYLNHQISDAGGLSGLGTRTILETIQTVLQYAVNLVLPFWEIGFIFAALRLARGEQAEFYHLSEGFRRFGPVLRLYLLEGIVYMGAGMISMYIGAFLYSITPLSLPMQKLILPVMESGGSVDDVYAVLDAMSVQELMGMFLPALIMIGVIFAVLALLLHYRFRMAQFLVMDQPGTGAMMALLVSNRMTRHHRMKLFRLDLSFWWFYVLVAISGVTMYADVLLGYAGIELPLSADVMWIVSYILGCLIRLVIYRQYYGYVQTTYAEAYEALRTQPVEGPKHQPAPKNLPWNDDYQTPQ